MLIFKKTVPKAEIIKANYKASISNKYIGFGKVGSSTASYYNQLKAKNIPVNSIEYMNSDIVFVSINGNPSKVRLSKTVTLVILALEAGGVILTDSANYLVDSSYNKGEKLLAKLLYDLSYRSYEDPECSLVNRWKKI